MLQYLSSWFRDDDDEEDNQQEKKSVGNNIQTNTGFKSKNYNKNKEEEYDDFIETDFQKDKKKSKQKALPNSSLPTKIKRVRKSVRFSTNVHSKTKKRDRY